MKIDFPYTFIPIACKCVSTCRTEWFHRIRYCDDGAR